jgi:hypothetical protein
MAAGKPAAQVPTTFPNCCLVFAGGPKTWTANSQAWISNPACPLPETNAEPAHGLGSRCRPGPWKVWGAKPQAIDHSKKFPLHSAALLGPSKARPLFQP